MHFTINVDNGGLRAQCYNATIAGGCDLRMRPCFPMLLFKPFAELHKACDSVSWNSDGHCRRLKHWAPANLIATRGELTVAHHGRHMNPLMEDDTHSSMKWLLPILVIEPISYSNRCPPPKRPPKTDLTEERDKPPEVNGGSRDEEKQYRRPDKSQLP